MIPTRFHEAKRLRRLYPEITWRAILSFEMRKSVTGSQGLASQRSRMEGQRRLKIPRFKPKVAHSQERHGPYPTTINFPHEPPFYAMSGLNRSLDLRPTMPLRGAVLETKLVWYRRIAFLFMPWMETRTKITSCSVQNNIVERPS